jgi:hypothetical protein
MKVPEVLPNGTFIVQLPLRKHFLPSCGKDLLNWSGTANMVKGLERSWNKAQRMGFGLYFFSYYFISIL